MEPLDKVILYGVFDGLNLSSDGSRDILVTLENGDRVDIPQYFVKKASDFVEKDRIKLKDIIARMEVLSDHVRSEWLTDILYKFGEEFGSKKYRDGYEQGKLEGEWVGQQLKDADKVRQELNNPVVPQIVADYIKYAKEHDWDLQDSMNWVTDEENRELHVWFFKGNNIETFARAWLDGYTVEKEKRYLVKMKSMDKEFTMLKFDKVRNTWYLGNDTEYSYTKVKHTRKELEEAGFGDIFNSPLFEVEEVE